jgi:hypothetical protein
MKEKIRQALMKEAVKTTPSFKREIIIDKTYQGLYILLINTIKWHTKALKQLRKINRGQYRHSAGCK